MLNILSQKDILLNSNFQNIIMSKRMTDALAVDLSIEL